MIMLTSTIGTNSQIALAWALVAGATGSAPAVLMGFPARVPLAGGRRGARVLRRRQGSRPGSRFGAVRLDVPLELRRWFQIDPASNPVVDANTTPYYRSRAFTVVPARGDPRSQYRSHFACKTPFATRFT